MNSRTWITARLEGNSLRVVAHAAHGFGEREAVVHQDITDGVGELRDALRGALHRAHDDLAERAEEAALVHRVRSRELGEDFHAPQEHVALAKGAD